MNTALKVVLAAAATAGAMVMFMAFKGPPLPGPAGELHSALPYITLKFDERHRTAERLELVGNELLAVQRTRNTNDFEVYGDTWMLRIETTAPTNEFYRVKHTGNVP